MKPKRGWLLRANRFLAEAPARDKFGLSAEVTIQASAAGEGEAKLARFEMLAYTGESMELMGWDHPVVIDVQGLNVPKQKRPILLNHNRSAIVGHSESIKKDGGKLLVAGIVSGAGAEAAQVLASAKNGFPWQASVGGVPTKTRFVKAGQTVRVNGKEFAGPVYVVRASVLEEISFVALGADGDTEARVAAARRKESPMGFEAFVASLGFEASSLTDEQREKLTKLFEAQKTPGDGQGQPGGSGGTGSGGSGKPAGGAKVKAGAKEGDDGDDNDDPDGDGGVSSAVKARRKQEAEESRRISAIRKICIGKHADLEAKAIEEGWTVDHTELQVLRASRPKAPAIGGSGSPDVNLAKVFECSILLSEKVEEKKVAKWFDEKTIEAAMSPRHRVPRLSKIIHAMCEGQGVSLGSYGGIEDAMLPAIADCERTARVEARRAQFAASGVTPSSVSVSGILGDSANKLLEDSFDTVPTVVDRICKPQNLKDFKAHTAYRMTGNLQFEKLPKNGEVRHGTLSEDSFTTQADTFAKMLVLDRRDIINDDLGAFLQIFRMMGRGAALAREDAMFTLWHEQVLTFFASGNNNYFEGASTNLSIDALTEALRLYRRQVDSASKPIGIEPAILFVPATLEVLAYQLFKDLNIVTGSTGKNLAGNPHTGKFQPVMSPYLDNTSYTNSSTTAWYLLANPADEAVMTVGYLNGMRTPTIQPVEVNGNILGVGWLGYYDFGFGMREKRAGVRSKGAA